MIEDEDEDEKDSNDDCISKDRYWDRIQETLYRNGNGYEEQPEYGLLRLAWGLLLCSGVAGGYVAKGHGRADGSAGAGIGVAHNRC